MNFFKVILLFFLINNLSANEMHEYIEKRDIVEFAINAPDKKIANINSVKVTEGHNQIAFDITIIADNYHTCSLKGIAKMENGYYRYREKFDNGKECLLTFHQKGKTLTLEDKGFACRRMYCGMRAGFDDHTFKIKK